MAEEERKKTGKIRKGEANVLIAKEPDCELWQRKRGRKRGEIRKGEENVLLAKATSTWEILVAGN